MNLPLISTSYSFSLLLLFFFLSIIFLFCFCYSSLSLLLLFSVVSSFVFSTSTILFLFFSILHSSALDDYPSSNHRLQRLSIYDIISFIFIISPCCVSLSETCALLGYAFFLTQRACLQKKNALC